MAKSYRAGGRPYSKHDDRMSRRFASPLTTIDPAPDRLVAGSAAVHVLHASELPEFQSVLLGDRHDLEEARQWLREHGIRSQSDMRVMGHNNRFTHAFVFKKRKHAAHFKLVWG